MMRKIIPFILITLFSMAAYAQDTIESYGLFEDLDGIASKAKLNEDQRTHGYSTLFNHLIECEFDESCYLRMISALEERIKTDKNPLYPKFLEVLKRIEPDLKNKVEVCNVPAKKELRKALMVCVNKYFKGYSFIKPKPDAHEEMLDNIWKCQQEPIFELAEKGNIYAQAAAANYHANLDNLKEMNVWYSKMMNSGRKAEYNQFMKCPELP